MKALSAILQTRRGSIEDWNFFGDPLGGATKDVCYGNGKWVVVGTNNHIAISNGSSPSSGWTMVNSPFVAGTVINHVVYANGYWVILDLYNLYIGTSVDGINWTLNTNTHVSSHYGSDLAYGNGVFKILAQAKAGQDPRVYTATIPTGAWTHVSVPAHLGAQTIQGISYGGGYWIMSTWGYRTVGGYSHQSCGILYSATGTSWSYCTVPELSPYGAVTNYGNSQWIGTGSRSYKYTTGGVTSWQSRTIIDSEGGTKSIYGYTIEYGNGTCVICGYGSGVPTGLVYNTGALPSYFSLAIGTSGGFAGAHYNGDYWVAVGGNGIFYSGPGV